jgi:hypothetical protein
MCDSDTNYPSSPKKLTRFYRRRSLDASTSQLQHQLHSHHHQKSTNEYDDHQNERFKWSKSLFHIVSRTKSQNLKS